MENNGKYDKDAEHNVLCPTELEIIGKQLQESREARKRTREEITWGFLEGVDLRRIEEGGGCDFFVLRFLMERLHIPLKLENFYLSAQDNILVNLESEMEYDLLFWRYGDVNLKLEKYYKLCDHENCLHMLVYYRFYAMLSIWRGSGDKDETGKIWNFIKRWMPNFEIRLHNREPFSLDELALIIMYYCLVEEKTEIRLKIEENLGDQIVQLAEKGLEICAVTGDIVNTYRIQGELINYFWKHDFFQNVEWREQCFEKAKEGYVLSAVCENRGVMRYFRRFLEDEYGYMVDGWS